MSNKINELSSKRTKLISDAQILVTEGKAGTEEYKAMIAEIDATQEHIDMLSRLARMMPDLPTPVPIVPVVAAESREHRRGRLNAAWRSFLQGRYDDRIAEHRDLLTSTDGGGGAVVQQEFSGFLSETLKYYCPLFNYANVRKSKNGRSVKIGRVSDQTHGLTLITEGSSTPVAEVDPAFSSSLVSTDLFTSGIIRFSNQLLSDSEFDLEQLLTNLSSTRVGRGLETLLTLGTDSSGTATPNNSGLLSLAQTATTTGSIAGSIGWSDIESTFDALDASYLPKSIWQMSSKTRNFLTGLKDSTGRPYFTPSTDGSLDYLLGRPVVLNQSLVSPTAGVFAANSKPILFGSLYDGFQIVSSDVHVQTVHERYAEFNESAIIVSTRVGSASLQAGAIQALRIAAS